MHNKKNPETNLNWGKETCKALKIIKSNWKATLCFTGSWWSGRWGEPGWSGNCAWTATAAWLQHSGPAAVWLGQLDWYVQTKNYRGRRWHQNGNKCVPREAKNLSVWYPRNTEGQEEKSNLWLQKVFCWKGTGRTYSRRFLISPPKPTWSRPSKIMLLRWSCHLHPHPLECHWLL